MKRCFLGASFVKWLESTRFASARRRRGKKIAVFRLVGRHVHWSIYDLVEYQLSITPNLVRRVFLHIIVRLFRALSVKNYL